MSQVYWDVPIVIPFESFMTATDENRIFMMGMYVSSSNNIAATITISAYHA